MNCIFRHIFALSCLSFVLSANSQVFQSQQTLYSNAQTLSGWYTEAQYSPIASYEGSIYFVMLDSSRVPFVGKIQEGQTTLETLEKDYPSYTSLDDGHHEFSLGTDRDGYIHVTGDMHNFPQASLSPQLPEVYKNANMLYWKSKNSGDITNFDFVGLTPTESIPGEGWSYGRFVNDRLGRLYYVSRTLARTNYYQTGGRGLGLYRYDEVTKSWKAYGKKAPISDSSFAVVAWEESGQNGGSYQQFKGDITFDQNNRLYLTTGMNTQNGPAQVNSIVFAYSDDGGDSFQKADGSLIALPMQVVAGVRQGDVIDSDPAATFEQPGVSYAFGGNPIVQYTANGSEYYKYWTGTEWSGRALSPSQSMRGRLLFNDYEQKLYFINIQSGSFYSQSSFGGVMESYDAGVSFRYFDTKLFREKNILNGISWKASTGSFEVLQLVGDTSLVEQPTTSTHRESSFGNGLFLFGDHRLLLQRSLLRKPSALLIYNMAGQIVFRMEADRLKAERTLDLGFLERGAYMIRWGSVVQRFIRLL